MPITMQSRLIQIPSSLPFSWQPLLVGAGGFIQGMQVAQDNTLICRTDTYAAYKWNASATSPIGATGVWQPLISSATMPTAFVSGSTSFGSVGCYEVQMCYKNSSIMYMVFQDTAVTAPATWSTVYKSTDGGATWAYTGFGQIDASNAPANEPVYKEWGPKIAVDPNDPNKVYVGTKAGLKLSTNGGTSFSSVSTGLVPAATLAGAYTGMQIAAYNSNIIYIASDGNGVYRSSDGGTSFTHITTGTGPTRVSYGMIDELAGTFQGNYYVIDNAAHALWRWNGTTWANITPGGVSPHGIAVDPNLSGHIITYDDTRHFDESFDAGSTWNGLSTTATVTGDVGWIVTAPPGLVPCAHFDRSAAKTVYVAGDNVPTVCTWSSNITTSTSVGVEVRGRGIEQIVGNNVVVPLGGSPLASGWDFGTHYKGTINSYPTTYGPSYPNFSAAWSTDIAQADASNRIVVVADDSYVGGTTHRSSYSDNGGQTWTIFGSTPAGYGYGGCIAASTSTNFVRNSTATRQPYRTSDAGTTWTPITISGVSDWGDWPYYTTFKNIAADRVNANQFTMMLNGAQAGFYKTTDAGANWTSLGNNNSSAQGSGAQMKSVPGQANHLWLATGSQGAQAGLIGANTAIELRYSADAGTTWTKVDNMRDTYSVGFGKAAVSYPNVFVAGCLKLDSISTVAFGTGTKAFLITGSPAHTILAGSPVMIESFGNGNMRGQVVSYVGGVLTIAVDTLLSGTGSQSTWTFAIFGVYRTTGGQTATPTWIQFGTFPNNSLDVIRDIEGDPNILGRCYLSFGGSGFAYYGSAL